MGRAADFSLSRMGNQWRVMSREVTCCDLCDILEEDLTGFADGSSMAGEREEDMKDGTKIFGLCR